MNGRQTHSSLLVTDNAATAERPVCSIVVPVYGGEGCLDELYTRLVRTLEDLKITFEIVLIEDCGPDGSWNSIQRLAIMDPRVRGFQHSRNFGQHVAISAGLEQARGDYVVVMDCDLQDPPEAIPRLIAEYERGYEIVYVLREKRKDAWWKRTASYLYFEILRLLTGARIDSREGTFSLLSRKVVDAFVCVKSVHRHYLMVLRWLGFRSTRITVEHGARFAGRSSYTLTKLVQHALVGITSQSVRLLHLSIYMGLACFGGAMVAAVWIVYRHFFTSIGIEGWASLMLGLLVIGGLILFSIGVLGLYVGRLFEQARGMPLYVFRESTEIRPARGTGREPQ